MPTDEDVLKIRDAHREAQQVEKQSDDYKLRVADMLADKKDKLKAEGKKWIPWLNEHEAELEFGERQAQYYMELRKNRDKLSDPMKRWRTFEQAQKILTEGKPPRNKTPKAPSGSPAKTSASANGGNDSPALGGNDSPALGGNVHITLNKPGKPEAQMATQAAQDQPALQMVRAGLAQVLAHLPRLNEAERKQIVPDVQAVQAALVAVGSAAAQVQAALVNSEQVLKEFAPETVEGKIPEALLLNDDEEYIVGDAAVADLLKENPIWFINQASNLDTAPHRWTTVNGKSQRQWTKQEVEDTRAELATKFPNRKAA